MYAVEDDVRRQEHGSDFRGRQRFPANWPAPWRPYPSSAPSPGWDPWPVGVGKLHVAQFDHEFPFKIHLRLLISRALVHYKLSVWVQSPTKKDPIPFKEQWGVYRYQPLAWDLWWRAVSTRSTVAMLVDGLLRAELVSADAAAPYCYGRRFFLRWWLSPLWSSWEQSKWLLVVGSRELNQCAN